jgi:hypothetical protein
MDNEEKKILVFINTTDHEGHGADFRYALKIALDTMPFGIFDDMQKTPENIFSATVWGILMSNAVLLDQGSRSNGISFDSLIQYGICCALEKKCILVAIKNYAPIIASGIRDPVVEGIIEFDCYLDFATQFKLKFLEWFNRANSVRGVQPNRLAVHSFAVIGVDRWKSPDLYEIVTDFCAEKGWKPRVYMDLGSLSKLENLAKAAGKRSFCMFCVNNDSSEEVFVGIGIAIGMGRPFLIIKPKSVKLPVSLNGYRGIIEYESYSQLRVYLEAYTEIFLSDDVLKWEGASYNDLLSRIEKHIDRLNPKTLNDFEDILLTINSVLDHLSAKPLALLGEIYREKNRKISPDDIQLLQKAKEYYEKALGIQKDYQLYQNAVSAIDKHIQLIELIKEKKYRSIPVLINLIGGDIKGEHYLQVREYLLSVVNKLVEEKDYVHAISLLAAMQIHDKSDQIQSLVKRVLDSAPQDIIKALQDSQEYVVELGKEKTRIMSQIQEKEKQLNKFVKELNSSKNQVVETKANLEQVQKQYNVLDAKIKDITTQLSVLNENKDKLETEIESFGELGGRGVIVDFGDGWAIYRALHHVPYVIRDGERLPARKGLVLLSGDVVYDENDHGLEEFLSKDAIIIRPGDDLYYQLLNRSA